MARKPFRSPLLGCVLIVIGAVALLSIPVITWRDGSEHQQRALVFILSSTFVAPVLLMVGVALIRRDAAAILADSAKRPIVYLRPFRQEKVSSPGNEPWNTLVERVRLKMMNAAVGTGLVMTFFVAVLLTQAGGVLATIGTTILTIYLVIVWLMLLYAPIYVCRKIRGRIDVTLEQELCHCFRRFGPIVAVGRPGELFAPEGGARAYLDDDTWQPVVLDLVKRARIIVVHLVPDGWTWWEFCQSITGTDPTRVLAVIIGQFFTDESYALLRHKVQQEFGITLCEARCACALVSFDADRTPHYLTLRRIPWFLWPFASYRLSRSTFKPFLLRLGLTYRFSREWWRARLIARTG
jgi:hypothetical protein